MNARQAMAEAAIAAEQRDRRDAFVQAALTGLCSRTDLNFSEIPDIARDVADLQIAVLDKAPR
jgi:hypothetical protein